LRKKPASKPAENSQDGHAGAAVARVGVEVEEAGVEKGAAKAAPLQRNICATQF
jgi:hypothetical protein